MSTEIIGLSHLEREIIANVVRYNIRDFDYDMMQLETEAGQDLAGVSDRTAITILIAKLTASCVWQIPWTRPIRQSSLIAVWQ